SAAYNLWPVSRAKWLLRRFDQCGIYAFIAATCTALLSRTEAGMPAFVTLAVIWSGAFAGAVLKLLWPGRLDRITVGYCYVLGLTGAVFLRLGPGLQVTTLELIIAGGILYSAGLPFYLWERLRFQNAIWHGFVVAGAACHFAAVLRSLPG